MARYSKIRSNYVLRKKHMTTERGVIYERDWVTLGERHMLETGKRPIYYDGNFVFTDNTRINTKKRHKLSTDVSTWTYDDVKNAKPLVNKVTVNMRSYDLRDFAYYGSCRDLIRVSVMDIINWFPANVLASGIKFYIDNQETEYFELINDFHIDFVHTMDEVTELDNPLRFMASAWDKYNLRGVAVTDYVVEMYDFDHKCLSNNEGKCIQRIDIKGGEDNAATIYGYYIDGEVKFVTDDPALVLQPNQTLIDDYFDNLEGFEKLLLNRETAPLYQNRFLTPILKDEEEQIVYVYRDYTWPSLGYCPRIDTVDFENYVNALYDIAEIFDDTWCDNLYRNMTHEAIKNFDWSYTRVTADNDEHDDYVEGGQVMSDFLRVLGRQFDDMKRHIDGIRMTSQISYDRNNNMADAEISDKLELEGWDVVSTIPAVKSGDDETVMLSEFSIDKYTIYSNTNGKIPVDVRLQISRKTEDGEIFIKQSPSLLPMWFPGLNETAYTSSMVDVEFVRQMLMASKHMLRTKGTLHGIEMIMGMFGLGRGVDYELGEAYKKITPIQAYSNTEFGYASVLPWEEDKIAQLRARGGGAVGIDNPYQDIPMGHLVYKDRDYIIPMYDQNKVYNGDVYFQGNGGWGRHWPSLDEQYAYTETLSYLREVDSVDELYNMNPRDLSYGTIVYVNSFDKAIEDTDQFYVDEGEPQPSNYFALVNEFDTSQVDSWRNIVMDTTREDFVDDDLYRKAVYLTNIVSVNTGNNPHVGYGKYDMGNTYDQYMGTPFKYFIEHYTLNDADMMAMMDYSFTMEYFGARNLNGTDIDDDGNDVWNVSKIRSASECEDKNDGITLERYFINDKLLVIKNLHEDKPQYIEYFMNVIFPYLAQMLPATVMLQLDGFVNATVVDDDYKTETETE